MDRELISAYHQIMRLCARSELSVDQVNGGYGQRLVLAYERYHHSALAWANVTTLVVQYVFDAPLIYVAQDLIKQ